MTLNDLKRPQLTSNNLKLPQKMELNKPVKERKLKRGGKTETNDENCDETLHTIILWTEIAIQKISNDEVVRRNTVQDIKGFDSQPVETQAKKENN